MKIPKLYAFLCAALITLISGSAQANVLGDMQTFSSNTDGLDFITVYSGRSLQAGYLSFNGHATYAKNHLLVYRTLASQDRLDYSDQLADLDFSFAYGISDRFQVFLANNYLMWQQSEVIEGIDVNITNGWNVLRPGVKYVLSRDYNIALVLSVDILTSEQNPYTGVDTKNIYNAELAKTFDTGNFIHGINVGFRKRTPTLPPADGRMFPLDDQVTASYGITTPSGEGTRAVFEAIGSYPLKQKYYRTDQHASSLDLLLALHHTFNRRLSINGGGTIEPISTLSPQYRLFAGLTYYWNLNRAPSDTASSAVLGDSSTRAGQSGWDATYGRTQSDASYTSGTKLRIKPETLDIFEGSRRRFSASGGEPHYTFFIVSGGGSIESDTGQFTAPFMASTVVVEVVDRAGSRARAKVIVRRAPKADKELRLKNLKFKFDTSDLIAESRQEIERTIKAFKQYDIRLLIVEGHTDSMGSDAYNLNLSQERAAAVKGILMRRLNLSDDQVDAIGFGEQRPVASNKTAAGRLQNRRVDLKLYFKK